MLLVETLSLISVGILWGCTNPIIKRNSMGIMNVNNNNGIHKFLWQALYLITHIKHLIPLLINQSGSVLYFLTLQNVDISLSIPIANSITFVFTALTGWFLGEQLPKTWTIIGTVCILLGTFCCCYAKH